MTTASQAELPLDVARDRERHEDEPALRDRRVGQHPHHVGLLAARRGSRASSTPRRGSRGSAATSRLEGKNPNLMIVSRATKPPAFDATERNAVTGSRRTLVGVGRPEVERHRADLEREADQGEEDRGREQRGRVACWRSAMMSVSSVESGHAVHERHAVEHHGGRQHADEEVLQRRLVRLRVVLAPAREDERRDRDRLERHEDRDEVARRRP